MPAQALTSRHYYLGLLASLIAVFGIAPFFDKGTLVNQLLNASFIVTLLFSVLVISHSKKFVIVASILAIPFFLENLQLLFGYDIVISTSTMALCGTAFVLIVIITMLRDMFTSTTVDLPLIIGAVSLYFLLGMLWGLIYLAISQFFPGSFHFDFVHTPQMKDQAGMFMYYSIVTLTTLGYGDIIPLSPPARAMASMEAIAGQIYLTVLVARFVGMHIAQGKQ